MYVVTLTMDGPKALNGTVTVHTTPDQGGRQVGKPHQVGPMALDTTEERGNLFNEVRRHLLREYRAEMFMDFRADRGTPQHTYHTLAATSTTSTFAQ